MSLTPSPALYRGMDRATLDAAYNNSAAVKDSAAWTEDWRRRSAQVRQGRGVRLDIPYADGERTKFDYVPAGVAKAPLFVFIHGGYWVRNSRDMFSFLAAGPNAHGIDFVSVGYTLAPQARLAQIVDEIRRCLTHLAAHADDLGFDRARIFVSGWSAGGHLAAITCDHPAVRGALPISGIFDLEPVALNYLNEPLQLTAEDIAILSPQRRLRAGLAPQRLVAGGNELAELQRQSRDYAAAAQAQHLDVTARILPGHHHFSILDELAKPDGEITNELVKLIAETSARRGTF
jgi:arylformamidase